MLLMFVGITGNGCGYIWIDELSLENQVGDSNSADSETENSSSETSIFDTSTFFERSTATFEDVDSQLSTDTATAVVQDTVTDADTRYPADTATAVVQDTVTDADTQFFEDTASSPDTQPSTDTANDSNSVALRFDGTDEYLSFGDLMLSTGTISFWLKTTAQDAYIVSRVQIGGSKFGEGRIRLVDAQLTFTIEDPAIHEVTADATVNDDTWHHIACTFHPGMAVFVDGVRQESTDTTAEAGFEVENEIFTVGNNTPLDEGYYEGLIDEMAMYSRALTESEIHEIWNNRRSVNLSQLSSTADLAHWWRMGDGDTAPLIADHVGNIDATMVNMDTNNFVADAP